MVLSKREQMIVVVTAIAFGLLIGNKFVYDPYHEKRAALVDERDKLAKELEDVKLLVKRRDRDQAKYKQLTTDGFQSDADADNKVSKALEEWSGKCGLNTSSTRPERVAGDKDLQEYKWMFSGTGNLSAAASFIWEIERSELPIKITSMTLGSTSDSGDQMSLTLGVSAVYPNANKAKAAPKAEVKANADDAL
jgi:hypothetical protein